MKRRNRILAVIVLVILLVVAALELILKILHANGIYENRGGFCVGPVCFSAFELILLALSAVASLVGGYCVYVNFSKKNVLSNQALDALGEIYLRIVRINFYDGGCLFIKDNDELTDRLFVKMEWNEFREKLAQMVHPEDLEMFRNFTSLGNMRRVSQNMSGTDTCTYRRIGDGEYKWIRVLITPMREKKYQNCIMLYARDVEETAKAEEYRKAQMLESLQKAKESEAEKADYLKYMFYELYTPMQAVGKMGERAQAAMAKGDYDKAHYYVERAKGLGRYSATTLNDIMRRGIMLEQYVKVNKAPFSVRGLLAACKEYAKVLTVDDVTFELNEDEALRESYIGDSLRLKQVLFCLLSNAYKFNRQDGSVKLSAIIEKQGAEADKVTFVVEDTGCGIGGDFLPNLFEPFAKENQPTEIDNVGVGYGLAFAKSVSDALGASIDVDTSLGQGSKFTVSLWLKRAE